MGIRLDKSRSPSAGIRKHVYEASKHRKVVDTEDVHNVSRRDGKTGKVTSETVRTEKREVGKNNMQCNPQIPSITGGHRGGRRGVPVAGTLVFTPLPWPKITPHPL